MTRTGSPASQMRPVSESMVPTDQVLAQVTGASCPWLLGTNEWNPDLIRAQIHPDHTINPQEPGDDHLGVIVA